MRLLHLCGLHRFVPVFIRCLHPGLPISCDCPVKRLQGQMRSVAFAHSLHGQEKTVSLGRAEGYARYGQSRDVGCCFRSPQRAVPALCSWENRPWALFDDRGIFGRDEGLKLPREQRRAHFTCSALYFHTREKI
uniref:Uncharacterized protein n=1 Tax=viral metagenome TaxID=1070528 RepID=A0A6C0C2B9_9ZZZZ